VNFCIFMQKQVKYTLPYPFLLLLIPLFFLQCQMDDENEEKVDYQGTMKYFPDAFGIERFITDNANGGVYITLPECFEINHYIDISIKNTNNYYCYDNEVYFSADPIDQSTIPFYAEFFEDSSIKKQDDLSILRDYVIAIRKQNTIEASESIYSSMTTSENKKILLGSVKGHSDPYSKELLYQYGVIAVGDTYYILQCIMSADNAVFLHGDVLEIFKSFKVN